MERNENKQSGCLGYILQQIRRLFPTASKESGPLPYRVRDDFLSPAELSYYQVLKSVLGSKAVICAKVRLADLLFVARPNENFSYVNKIRQKHIDFLICDAATMKPALAIELDDSSHNRARRKKRDLFINEALTAADFPLLRVTAQRQYSQQQVIDQLKPFLSKPKSVQPQKEEAGPVTPQETSSEKQAASVPNCPKCGIPMVLRVANQGKHKGERFYGCTNYPRCRELLPIPADNMQD